MPTSAHQRSTIDDAHGSNTLVDGCQPKLTMLISQTAINFLSNVFSAAFGLLNVVIFTRLLSAGGFGIYALGMAFASISSTLLSSWLRIQILRVEPRGDGTDVRSIVLPGLVLSCFVAPLGYGVARWAGFHSNAATAAVFLAVEMFSLKRAKTYCARGCSRSP